MQRLYQAANRIEAQLLLDLLARHRIDAAVFGDYLAGAAGELPADILPTLWLTDERDLARARQLLTDFLNPPPAAPAADWDCPACGEQVEGDFDLCWNCGRARVSSH
ncbi:DUF2007 domain-containing protein [Candidatus Thiodictyon syntrophicum]|jgi:hypothetical protein|uniref:Uncharacterized protein n=1 Tax=Candidatus Thiodictyon syntrophicum TaxID=1166950 RepID=A0A2K8U2L4_9GAMM|nr:DUF2007 domain-containing protein [Candidatus Thiodictyon syntrophicum]AUB79826.1 hypothetical protein THSYN_01860 [Candidatus Thiodictyon syntrophicum]